jgi:rhodanese-related sulfurtransferase
MKLVADRRTGKFLGLQVFGVGEAVKRIDVAATALKFGASVKDISDTDLAYAPPFSTAIDAVAHAANVVRNKIDLLARSITPINLKAKMDRGDDFVLLDVRSKKEVDELAITDSRFKHIPLGQLRERVNELHKGKEVVIYCKSSVRAWDAQRVLDNNGFKDVKFLEGGIAAWPYTP